MDIKRNLLIIDDEVEVLHTLKRIFHKGYELYVTESIQEAFSIMEEINIGVILCDQRMPEMKGTEFFTQVMEKYPQTIRILLTAYSELSDVITSINEAHIYRYVSKPWNLQDLKSSVEEGFEKYQLIRDNLNMIEALKRTNQNLLSEIQERRKSEQKVLRLASIVESTEGGIMLMTLAGIITDWNRGAEIIYGYTEAEMIGESIIKLIPKDKHHELDQMLSSIAEGVSMTHYETIRQREDGALINVYYTVSPIRDQSGKIVGVSKIVNDLTAQKKLENDMIRLDQMNVVGEMAASIAHEVRNPMTTVRGFLQLLEGHENSAKCREYIPLMISELDRANSIISEFLSISRTKTTEVVRCNLNAIIERILPLLQVDAIREEKSVISYLNVIPDLQLDQEEIRQVILNLVRNGLQAMDKGGCLTITTSLANEEVILAIQDEGKGINREIMDKLGTPFLTTKEQGTGLGLAICFSIAARHNSKITAETSPQGSVFFMKFKL
ncbi:MAG TPA: PAS domain S-box protein [Desulfosporosinus sp.]|nr:PAS domain S-box protein [Desulfosporosinus sp.]